MGESWGSRWQRALRARGYDWDATECLTYHGVTLPFDAPPGLVFDDRAVPRQRRASYEVIGADGLYNSVGVEDGTGAVWLLDWTGALLAYLRGLPPRPVTDYPPGWGDGPPLHRQFVNTGVLQLAECLLAYVEVPDPGRLRAAVAAIDPPALAEGAFWWQEAPAVGAALGERYIRECVTTMGLAVPPAAWEEFVARVRHMVADGVNMWDAAESCALPYARATSDTEWG